ncbi:hypothetical protein HYQ44_014700 [Verticillium longisporum]|nr:hypothetical protein HYQ44_014700 [Verticillium longisporum]
MDWVQDFSGLNASDLERGFRYHWRSSTVVKLSSTGKLLTRSLNSEKDWQKWLDDEVPNLDYKNVDGGLILLLTSRCDRGSYRSYVYNARTSEEWEGDLALTATYFPCHRLTFGILFGCDETIEGI